MTPVHLFALVGILLLALLLARYAPSAAARRAAVEGGGAPGPRLDPDALRDLVVALLGAQGLRVTDEVRVPTGYRLSALQPAPFRDQRYVVFLEVSPPGDLVEQPTIVELAEAVKAEAGAVGLLVTPHRVDPRGLGGLEVPLELVDGRALRDLVARHLPGRVGDLEAHGVGGPLSAAPEPAR